MASVEMQKAAADLVERSRCGDQVATAMIIEIRAAALKGSPKAQIGFELLKKIIKANPVKPEKNLDGSEAVMGEEVYEALHTIAHEGPVLALGWLVSLPDLGGERGLCAASVILANGPRVLSKRFVTEIGQGIKEHVYRKCFFYGVNTPGRKGRKVARAVRRNGDAAAFIHAGRCVGLARAIQRVRHPESVISFFSRPAGWELGESAKDLNFEGMRRQVVIDVEGHDEMVVGDEDDDREDDREDEEDEDEGEGGGSGGGGSPSGGSPSGGGSPDSGGGSPDGGGGAPSGGGSPSGGGASPAPTGGGGASPDAAPADKPTLNLSKKAADRIASHSHPTHLVPKPHMVPKPHKAAPRRLPKKAPRGRRH